jgi:hypothetical protein
MYSLEDFRKTPIVYIGETVYVWSIKRKTGETHRISKVGRVYFELEGMNGNKFYIDSKREKANYASSYELYPSEECHKDCTIRNTLYDNIKRKFRDDWRDHIKDSLTIEELKTIHNMLKLEI